MKSGVEWINKPFIKGLARGLTVPSKFDEQAELIAERLKEAVLDRVSRGEYFGGEWASKGYSFNSIKAFKLGWAEVEGSKNEQTLFIDGIEIADDDWFWGRYDKKSPSFTRERKTGRKHIAKQWYSVANSKAPSFHGSGAARPTPIFLPGYKGWREKYQGLQTNSVDLSFTSLLLNNFSYEVSSGRKSGDNRQFIIEFVTSDEMVESVAQYTNYFRNWYGMTETEVQLALDEAQADLVRIYT